MANKDLKNEPHHIRGRRTFWWYEEPKGVCLVWEPQNQSRETQQATIPWSALRRALARKDAETAPTEGEGDG